MRTLLTPSGCLFAASHLLGFVDENYSGVSDVYEFTYFNGAADPYAHANGDGVSNYDEMIWGTDPTGPKSKITAPSATLNADTLQLSWPIAPYRIYTLEASEDLLTWQAVTNGAISGYVQALNGANPLYRFYRLSVTLVPTYEKGMGLADWEQAPYVRTFGVLPSARDSDGDGVSDLQEFRLGLTRVASSTWGRMKSKFLSV